MSDDIPALIARLRNAASISPARDLCIEAADALEATDAFARQMVDAKNAVIADLNKAQARIADLEAALEPFRKAAEALHPLGPNVQPVDVSIWSFSGGVDVENVSISFADLFKARAVLEKDG